MKKTEGYIQFENKIKQLDSNEAIPLDENIYSFRDMRCSYEEGKNSNELNGFEIGFVAGALIVCVLLCFFLH